jgi:DNA-binding transcriptional MerR regulator
MNQKETPKDTVTFTDVMQSNLAYLGAIQKLIEAIEAIEPPGQADPRLYRSRHVLVKRLLRVLKDWGDPLRGIRPRSRTPGFDEGGRAQAVADRTNAARRKARQTG